MKIGKFQLKAIETVDFALDGGAMFGVIPKPLWSKTYDPGDELNRIPLVARLLLMESENRKILIDTGLGNKYSEKFGKIYGFDINKSSVVYALEQHGVSAGEITDVILTHLHFDHVGGATISVNGKIEPTFPNAKYYVQKEHFEWANKPTYKDRASFLVDDYMPLYENGLLELIDGDGKFDDNIELILHHGHTKSMQLVKVFDDDNSLIYGADFLPTSAHILAPYFMGYDNFPLTVLEEKIKYLPQIFEEKTKIFFEHDVHTQMATIKPHKTGFILDERITI